MGLPSLLVIYLLVGLLFFFSPYLSSPSQKLLHLSPLHNKRGDKKPGARCGTERWSVKTGIDLDARNVFMIPIDTQTINDFRAIEKPDTLPPNNRIAPTEFHTYQIKCILTSFKRETDSDYHLVLDDGNGNTIIGEIPSPDCVGEESPFRPNITLARNQFDAQYSVSSSFQNVNQPVVVTGVAFFDFLHGQRGVAPNGFELHPILDIQFG